MAKQASARELESKASALKKAVIILLLLGIVLIATTQFRDLLSIQNLARQENQLRAYQAIFQSSIHRILSCPFQGLSLTDSALASYELADHDLHWFAFPPPAGGGKARTYSLALPRLGRQSLNRRGQAPFGCPHSMAWVGSLRFGGPTQRTSIGLKSDK